MALSNSIRYYHYISGVFKSQQSDPLCSICKAFENSINALRESLVKFEQKNSGAVEISGELSRLLSKAREILFSLNPPINAVGQKKAGNCKMPEGVCFIKSSKAIIEKIS